MAKASKKRKALSAKESDSAYFLKIILYFVLGAFWIRLPHALFGFTAIPIGFFIGILFASHDHFAIDRKVEYAILLAATLFTYLAAGAVLI